MVEKPVEVVVYQEDQDLNIRKEQEINNLKKALKNAQYEASEALKVKENALNLH